MSLFLCPRVYMLVPRCLYILNDIMTWEFRSSNKAKYFGTDYKKFWHHISIQNSKAIGIWVTILIYPTISSFLADIWLNHSYLNLTISLTNSQMWVSHILYTCTTVIINETHLMTTRSRRISIQGSNTRISPTKLNHQFDSTC